MSLLPPRLLLAGLASVLAIEVLIVAPHPTSLVIVAAGAWMVLPGIVLGQRLSASDTSGVFGCLIGPMLGAAFSVFGVFLWWAAGVQHWLALLLGPGLTWGLAWASQRLGSPTLRLPHFDRRDVVAVALVLMVVPLVTWAPYDHVREPVPDGEAYRAYFTADFVWAMTVTGEIAKGDVPARNPYLRQETLHYYWLAHFLSGSLYRNLAPWGALVESVVLLNGLLFGLAFVAFVYALARTAGATPAWSAAGVAAGFLANSYEGADMIRAILQHGQSWRELADTNIDAVTRWFYHGMAVDGLQRLLLYQPHHLTGYAMSLAALWLAGLAEDITETSVALLAGVLLAIALLFSTFTALIVGPAVGAVFVLRLVQRRSSLVAALQCAILGGVPVGVGVAVTTLLGYADRRHGSLLIIGLNPVAVHSLMHVWVLSFGPLLVGAAYALRRWQWLLREGAAAIALVAAATVFYFFTNVPDSGDVWVGWRSGHLLLIAFAVMSAAALSERWRRGERRSLVIVLLVIALVPAVPTVAIDVFNAQDVTNRRQGAGFPWTLVISPQEREALEWVRARTPQDAIVQVEPYARGSEHWSYIGAFASRRTAGAIPVSMVPLQPYHVASDNVYYGVFKAAGAKEAHTMARYLGIDYLFIGRPERRAYPETVQRLAAAPDLFDAVFRNDAVTIFRVVPPATDLSSSQEPERLTR